MSKPTLLSRLTGSYQAQLRLADAITLMQSQLESHRAKGVTASASRWATACDDFLEKAEAARDRRDLNGGYEFLYAAGRALIEGLSQEERVARVVSLRQEVEDKLGNSWRGKAARELLAGNVNRVKVEAIREALFHVQSRAQNVYRKLQLARGLLETIGIILVILIVIAWAEPGVIIPGDLKIETDFFRNAIFAGLLGGTLSAAFSSSQGGLAAKFPDMLHGYVLIAIRAVTGTAAAIPMLLLISAKMIPVVADNNAAVLGFCFLAGFSERWFLAVLKPLTDGKNKNS